MLFRLKRSTLTLIKFCALISLTTVVIGYAGTYLYKTANLRDCIPITYQPAVRIAIINSVFWHSEVWYSYVYAAGIRARFNVSLFTDFLPHTIQDENGFPYITRSWSRPYSYKMQEHVSQLLDSTSKTCSYQIIMMTTLDVYQLESLLLTLLNDCDKAKSYLLLIQIHEAAWDVPLLETCLDVFPGLFSQNRTEIRILALAHHVKKYIERRMKRPLSIDVWIPVFPLDLPEDDVNDEYHRYFDFVIQGYVHSNRRNYSGFIDEARKHAALLDKYQIAFTIVGRSNQGENHPWYQLKPVRVFVTPQMIPADIYYRLIHQSVGILPLFARDAYYEGTQSAAISTSFLTRTPLLASQRLLETHPHIPKESVWFKADGETDMLAVIRTVTSYPSRAAFRAALLKKRQNLKRAVESFCTEKTQTLLGYAQLLRQPISLF